MIFQIVIGIDAKIGGYFSGKRLIEDVQVGRPGGAMKSIDDPDVF
jgi:hypothetical protein